MSHHWPYYDLRAGKLYDEQGRLRFRNAPAFATVDEAEDYLRRNDLRGNVRADLTDAERAARWNDESAALALAKACTCQCPMGVHTRTCATRNEERDPRKWIDLV